MNTNQRRGGRQFCELLTLERIRDERCTEEGECWIWNGAMGGPGKTTPNLHFRGKVQPAYVATYLLDRGLMTIPKGRVLWRGCRNMRCVNPACIKVGTRAQRTAYLANLGAYKCSPSRKAKVTAVKRATEAKLLGGMAEARAIRAEAGTRPQAEIAAAHGVSLSRVSQIISGRAWRESVIPGASVFSFGEAA
jgi:hypothetical protein